MSRSAGHTSHYMDRKEYIRSVFVSSSTIMTVSPSLVSTGHLKIGDLWPSYYHSNNVCPFSVLSQTPDNPTFTHRWQTTYFSRTVFTTNLGGLVYFPNVLITLLPRFHYPSPVLNPLGPYVFSGILFVLRTGEGKVWKILRLVRFLSREHLLFFRSLQ